MTPDPAAGVSRETDDGRERAVAGRPDEGVSRETRPGMRTRIALGPIRFYRKLISPLLGPRCRYYPTCSAYAEDAIRTLGPARGFIVAAWRVLRCNPLSPGGLDPLENRRLFRPAREDGDTADSSAR